MKKWLGTAFLFSGAVIGAGMMTGAEIKKYFGSGYLSLVGILLSCILMSVMIYTITQYCIKNGINDVNALGEDLFGGLSLIFNIFIYFGIVSCCGAMLAGIGELFEIIFGIPGLATSAVMTVLGTIIAYKGVESIKKVNVLAVVLIVLFVIVLFVININNGYNYIKMPHNYVVFSLYNVSLMLPLCCAVKEGEGNLRKSLLLFCIIVFMVMSCIAVVISHGNSSALPLFDAAFNASGAFTVLYSICLVGASLSTYITSLISFSDRKRKLICASVVTYLISLINIDNIVKYIYPIFGILCIICIIKIILKWRKP